MDVCRTGNFKGIGLAVGDALGISPATNEAGERLYQEKCAMAQDCLSFNPDSHFAGVLNLSREDMSTGKFLRIPDAYGAMPRQLRVAFYNTCSSTTAQPLVQQGMLLHEKKGTPH